MRWVQAIEEIWAVLRPTSPTPITTTLDEAGASTPGFVSQSSIVPITIQAIESEDFKGFLGIDMKLAGDTWAAIWPDTPIIQIPEGGEIRARLLSLTAGSIVVTIVQGRVA